jgi:hypothetical protein
MSENETEFLSKPLLKSLHNGVSLAAVGAFIIAIFDKGDRRCRESINVVTPA